MIILYIAALAISLGLNIFLAIVMVRFSKRLLEFDELFELLNHDIDTNLSYLKKLANTPLFDNSNEVRTAHNNMIIISKRLGEFATRLKEASNRIENDAPKQG